MPSVTKNYDDSESGGPHAILENGLSLPGFQKVLQVNDNSSHASSPPDGGFSRQFIAPVGKKLTGRPPAAHQTSSYASLSSQASSIKSDAFPQDGKTLAAKHGDEMDLFSQVYEWLQSERSRQKALKSDVSGRVDGPTDDDAVVLEPESDSSSSLDRLENILLRFAASKQDSTAPGYPTRRPTRRRVKGLRRGSASESDYADSESAGPPSVDAVLDNSKALAFSGGAADDDGVDTTAKRKNREDWLVFKSEIIRLAHTLEIKGWRRISMEDASELDVVRLSGALTNAVYVITPPKNIPQKGENGSIRAPRRPPQKLLLRIYGPQVEHLIDRDNELQILRRLGRKNIGPRVLGTFKNGRFEQYFEARPLTPRDLRIPETSNHIAKRMKELHEGIELLREEREGGPTVLKNWDKWVDRCEQLTSWLDKEIQSPHNEIKAQSEPWRRRGLVCGVQWPVFRKAVDDYRRWLSAGFGGPEGIKRELVFAHNDTQYGNLLRMEPAGESPLLLPANEHKQLVVIDFEYASANTPGFEFANHFTEWCYNYHDPERSWACNTKAYPTAEEQRRFITAYLAHQPGFSGRPENTLPVRNGPSGMPLPSFRLDAEPGSNSLAQEAEKADEDSLEANVQYLMTQQRLWRVLNSAQWVSWGIVQAKVPGMEEALGQSDPSNGSNGTTQASEAEQASSTAKSPVEEAAEAGDEFDYLAFAQDRAMFLWADLLALKLVDEKDLPRELVEHVKPRIIEC